MDRSNNCFSIIWILAFNKWLYYSGVIYIWNWPCIWVTKEYIKDLHYPGIALSYGLYDFLNYIVTLTIA